MGQLGMDTHEFVPGPVLHDELDERVSGLAGDGPRSGVEGDDVHDAGNLLSVLLDQLGSSLLIANNLVKRKMLLQISPTVLGIQNR